MSVKAMLNFAIAAYYSSFGINIFSEIKWVHYQDL